MGQITVDKSQSIGVGLVFLSAIGVDDATRQPLFGIWAAGALSALTLAAATSGNLRQIYAADARAVIDMCFCGAKWVCNEPVFAHMPTFCTLAYKRDARKKSPSVSNIHEFCSYIFFQELRSKEFCTSPIISASPREGI